MSEKNLKQTSLSDRLLEDYERQQNLFSAQPVIVQRFLEVQGKQVAEALVDGSSQVSFTLPDRVTYTMERVGGQAAPVTIPQNQRTHSAGSFFNRFRKVDLYKELRHLLTELEQSPDRAVSVASRLLRHAIVVHMIYNMLPSGRAVKYKADEDESIPFIPESDGLEPKSAITAETDAIAEEGKKEEGRGDLLVPFVPYARKFYLPQWIAFNENGDLIAKSVDEAEAHIKSMQRFMQIMFLAVALAPYISANEEYAKKRYGMLGQLVNQARALATYQTKEIIARIKERAAAGSLNRGLSLSLPYFDDQELKLNVTNFEIIPAGRIMFVPAFVVRAAQHEEVKVAQDTRFNPSTRKHILYLLNLLQRAFESA